ncbi:hypothetical protein [Pseudofrankia sp. DC12]|uniref:hypothetical protein n=1 Tax=Pseudofrankia sp. DC12 TaxID=683315 RepID=UPI000A5E179E|nr:hypothetical protein [Pseudofrankia sp. DC12]
MSFVDSVISGDAEVEEISEWVAEWHDSGGVSGPLRTYLGFSWHEYAVWVLKGEALEYIVGARRAGVDFNEYLASLKDGDLVAAELFPISELHKGDVGPE